LSLAKGISSVGYFGPIVRKTFRLCKQQILCRGFDHGAGHLLLLYDAKAPHYRQNKAFKSFCYYARRGRKWPTR
jgi:hypothetical protein